MTTQHTPGPWKPVEFGGVQIGGGKNFEEAVCTMWDSRSKRGIANSRLIAASPELLDALVGAMDILGRAESNASGNPEWDCVGPRVAAARAAIAKATGQ
jgi:hypothetical protein